LRLAFASRPIFLRSPPRSDNYLTLCASDHRSRSATSRQARRRPNPRVAPRFRAFGCAGDGSLELPRASMPLALPVSASFPSCPGAPAFSCRACDEGLGSPLVLHLRLYRRSVIELPRCSHHSAVPTYRSSGCPSSSPSVSPTIRCPSRPERRILRHRLMDIRVTPDHAPPGSPWLNLQVAPDIFPSATTIDQFPGCPKSWVSHRAPIPRDSSCPESWFLG